MIQNKKKAVNDNGIILDVLAELARTREKYPNTRHLFAVLTSEVGALSEALLNRQFAQTGGDGNIYAEGIQVAAMAIRLIGEGDSSFSYYDPSNGYAIAKGFTALGVCTWFYDGEKGYYVTECNKEFSTSGTLRDNGMDFCNFCGKKIDEKREATQITRES